MFGEGRVFLEGEQTRNRSVRMKERDISMSLAVFFWVFILGISVIFLVPLLRKQKPKSCNRQCRFVSLNRVDAEGRRLEKCLTCRRIFHVPVRH